MLSKIIVMAIVTYHDQKKHLDLTYPVVYLYRSAVDGIPKLFACLL